MEISVNWVPGKIPVAIFMNEKGERVNEEALPDYGVGQLAPWLLERGFELKVRIEHYSDEPAAVASFQGSRYEFYAAQNSREQAEQFARSKGGHLLALESAEEASFLLKSLLGGGNRPVLVWIAASDSATEGEWLWDAGSSAGERFYSGTFENGNAMEGKYVAWNKGEPNNANGVSPENCAVAILSGYAGLDSSGAGIDESGALVTLLLLRLPLPDGRASNRLFGSVF